MEFKDLVGKVLKEVRNADDERIIFTLDNDERHLLYHSQDCCESVRVEDITGDLSDLVGTPILMAEESTNSDNPPEHAESFTWTFYRLRTIKGSVVIRWLGQSNGYYSESVDFE